MNGRVTCGSLCLSFAMFACKREVVVMPDEKTPITVIKKTKAVEPQTAKAEPPPPKSPGDIILENMIAAKGLPDAIEALKSGMSDTVDEVPPAGAVLLAWDVERGVKWEDISDKSIEGTTAKMIMKDSDEARGKRICATGTIIEIAADKLKQTKVYTGGIYSESGDIIRFAASGSTGDLVSQSYGTFCGIVIGRQDYANSAGGVAHAIYAVGMFNLPENHKPKQK